MTISKNRGGFTLVELLVVIAIIGTLVGLLLPAVQSAREAARRSACTNNLKQLGLGVLNFESARKRLPAANAGIGSNGGGSSAGGHSWLTAILPFLEETNLYTTISSNSNRLTSAFSVNTSAARTSLPQLVCPSFAGDKTSATGNSVTSCGVTNYKGIAGAGCNTGRTPYTSSNLGGVITLEKYGSESCAPYTGLTLAQITDGTSKTFMIGESREVTQAAWIDGQNAWLVAVKGNGNLTGASSGVTGGTLAILDNQGTAGTYDNLGGVITLEKYGSEACAPYTGLTLAQITDGTSKTFMIGESREVTQAAWIDGQNSFVVAVKGNGNLTAASTGVTGGTLAILDNQGTAGTYDNLAGSAGSTDYGESSNHQAGITLFGYADGHVGQVTPEIDATLMRNLHSRGGSEATGEQP